MKECETCDGTGTVTGPYGAPNCPECDGIGLMVPAELARLPVDSGPGSRWKVAVMARRYREGVGLWSEDDEGDVKEPNKQGGNPVC